MELIQEYINMTRHYPDVILNELREIIERTVEPYIGSITTQDTLETISRSINAEIRRTTGIDDMVRVSYAMPTGTINVSIPMSIQEMGLDNMDLIQQYLNIISPSEVWQKEVMRDPSGRILIVAPRQSGKTYTLIRKTLEFLCNREYSRVLFINNIPRQQRDKQMQYLNAIREYGLHHEAAPDRIILTAHRNEIHFTSMPNIDRGGTTYDYIAVDDADYIDGSVLPNILRQLRPGGRIIVAGSEVNRRYDRLLSRLYNANDGDWHKYNDRSDIRVRYDAIATLAGLDGYTSNRNNCVYDHSAIEELYRQMEERLTQPTGIFFDEFTRWNMPDED
jgi:SAM-dependent methyltransferase